MKDELGKRMKEQYEHVTRYKLPRRTYTIIRLDGKAFHTFTRQMKRPYDENLHEVMCYTAIKLCQEIQGAVFGYTQSDEISILLTDFAKPTTSAWFDCNLQKMVSVSASIATAYFNHYFFNSGSLDKEKLAFFDSRTFTMPDPIEVENYFIWRQKDAVRNSISMLAQSLYSHKQLNGKSQSDMQEMCFQAGKNWNDVDTRFKRGSIIIRNKIEIDDIVRHEWKTNASFDFLKNREQLRKLIPIVGVESDN